MKIIFFSNQLFDYPLKTNKWHVATRVAERGHQVLFVDPPIRFRKFVKQIFQGRWSLRRILTFTHRPQETLTIYTPVGLIPFSGGAKTLSKIGPFGQQIDTFLKRLDSSFHLWRIKKLLSGFQLQASSFKPPILWVYHVEVRGLEDFIKEIPHDLLIYDCVDNYPAFPRYREKPELKNWIVRREEWLARKADLVFTTAPGLQEKLSRFNKNTFYVGNAGDYGRFHLEGGERLSDAEIHLRGVKNTPKPIIGFTGAIDSYKVNLPLLVKVAKAYPNHSLVLIGPKGVADDEPNLAVLKSLPNVQFLGAKPYEEMPQYFSQFNVYIIPYNLNEYTLGGCFPVKFFDALAAGLPTVVTDLPCYQDFSEVCYIAKDDEDFVKLISTSLKENSAEKVRQRQRVAEENSWDKKVKRMLSILTTVVGGIE